jgi:hypothetical protein
LPTKVKHTQFFFPFLKRLFISRKCFTFVFREFKTTIMSKPKKIGILTAGGDCPGLNAAIRGVGKTAIVKYNMEVVGVSAGFLGLLQKDFIPLDEASLSGILTVGGTILGTSREKPF